LFGVGREIGKGVLVRQLLLFVAVPLVRAGLVPCMLRWLLMVSKHMIAAHMLHGLEHAVQYTPSTPVTLRLQFEWSHLEVEWLQHEWLVPGKLSR